ncbi:hypothetical protein JW796_00905 [Candidatus Dojkabacteria bacterium]|nr:hypothetical protein [Candidatus Dojkabacteria bacterium]
MKKIFSIIVSFIFIYTVYTTKVKADVAPIEYWGNGIVTGEHYQIALDKEILKFNVFEDNMCGNNGIEFCSSYFDVNVEFYFNNPGEDINVEVFFPVPGANMNEGHVREIVDSFSMNMNGENTELLTKNIDPVLIAKPVLDPKDTTVNVYSTLHFKKGENKLIVKYKNPLTSSYVGGYKHLLYILTTGSAWEGSIDELIIEVNFQYPISFLRYENSDAYYLEQKSANLLRYSAKNVEPIDDLEVSFMPYHVWQKVSPFLQGNEYSLSLKERFELDEYLSDWLGNKGHVELAGIFEDMYYHNLIILVEDGYDVGDWKKEEYARYLSRKYRELELQNGACYFEPTPWNMYLSDTLFKSLKERIVKYAGEKYLDEKDFEVDCNKYKEQKAEYPQTNYIPSPYDPINPYLVTIKHYEYFVVGEAIVIFILIALLFRRKIAGGFRRLLSVIKKKKLPENKGKKLQEK